MMIRPDDDELEMILSIAVKTAPNYAIRNVFSNRKMDRDIAIATIVQRVFQIIGFRRFFRNYSTVDAAMLGL